MKKFLQIVILGILLIGCKQPFESPVSQLSKDVLCMEGFINTGGEASVITLTRLQDLKDASAILPELKAKVFLQEENGAAIPLVEEGNGKYTLAARTYDTNKQYRLEITRSNGKKYQSVFVKATTTPPIDKLSYKLAPNGVFVLADTHNTNDAPRYYYWEQEETWLFSVPYLSKVYLVGENFVKRPFEVQFCYRTEKSNKLILGTTVNLTENTVKDQEVQFVDKTTYKLNLIYSIYVSQHAIDKEYFEYLQKIKNNTENIGSIFDAQPTQNTSNIFSASDPEETVVGFFNMHSVQRKRLFIEGFDLPAELHEPFKECNVEVYPFYFIPRVGDPVFLEPQQYFRDPSKYTPLDYGERLPFLSIVTGVSAECADCRIHGVLAKPSFWPY